MVNVATDDRGGREELDAFLRTRHEAIVVTRRGDGGDRSSPVDTRRGPIATGGPSRLATG